MRTGRTPGCAHVVGAISGGPRESIPPREGQWAQSRDGREMARCPPPGGRSTRPEEETAFETSTFPVLLRLSPRAGWEAAAPGPKPGDGEEQSPGGLTRPAGLRSGRAAGEERGYSLGSGVVQLVLSGAVKTSLDPVVSPQPSDHVGQVLRHDALLLGSAGERKQLPSIVLQGKNTA